MSRFLAALLMMTATTRADAAKPVVVELFTSQGCSSCPEADKLLSTWGAAEFKKGNVLPLSFNVDYWDRLGWKDLFSAPAWTQRQASYGAAIGERTYTPQLVVAGRAAFVGSDGARARAEARRFQGERPRVRLELKGAARPKGSVDIAATAITPQSERLHLVLVIFETGLVSDVGAGENAGRTLRNDFTVRWLVDLGTLGRDGIKRRWEPNWLPAWDLKRSGIAVFAQDPRSLAIHDAKAVFPLAK